jgi:H+-transporting ATPase
MPGTKKLKSEKGVESSSKSVPLPELQRQLQTSAEGLTGEAARLRLEKYGFNERQEKRINPVLKFFTYFWGPIPWMIEVAAALSALVRHWTDFIIIVVLLLANAVAGFWEEHKADNTIAELKAKLALKARVKRDGAWTVVPARELVPGDVIRLRPGDIIPSDVRLLEGDPVEVDQSVLTGESLPVNREKGQALFSSSIIKLGETDAVVEATGKETYIGRTAHLVESVRIVSHFQRAILKIGNYVIFVALALVVLILGVALLRGDNMITTLQFVQVLAVASIPVAMPTVLSVTMAIGAQNLARNKAVVSRLASIEEMAGIDVLCSDKTGTLTQNRLTLGEPFCVEGISRDELILHAALASRAEDQDAIDLTVLGAVKDKGALSTFTVEHFQPFNPVQKRTEATVKDPQGRQVKVTKGAPQVIMGLASVASELKSKLDQSIQDFAGRGYRSLGVARSNEQGAWQMLGIIPLYDPPRDDSRPTIKKTLEMGLKFKMLTGDQVAIAKEIARQLNLGTNILDASLFSEAEPHQAGRLEDAIETADGFAQVFPEHKTISWRRFRSGTTSSA